MVKARNAGKAKEEPANERYDVADGMPLGPGVDSNTFPDTLLGHRQGSHGPAPGFSWDSANQDRILIAQGPFRPPRSEELFRDAYVARPDRFDWRTRSSSNEKASDLSLPEGEKQSGRTRRQSYAVQRRRPSVSLLNGEETKTTEKIWKLRQRYLTKQGLSAQQVTYQVAKERAQIQTRREERAPIRTAAKAYRKRWSNILGMERAREMEEIKERRKSPIEKLVQDGIAIDRLQAYWQDNSRRHFGKRVAMFKLFGAQELPRNEFKPGDKVTLVPSESERSPALLQALRDGLSPSSAQTGPVPEDAELSWESFHLEAEIVEKQKTYLRLKFDQEDEKVDLVSCPSWRLDLGYNDLTFDRMQAALNAVDHDVEFIETRGGTKFQSMLSGTRLNDIILGVDPPSDRITRGAFWEDARIQSWYDRYARSDPLVLDGDPDLGLNASQTRAIAMMLRERVSLVQGPPGTGKTRTIVQAIKLLKHDFQVPHPILLAAHTNVAVDNLAEGCINAGLKVVRIGPSARARTSIESYTLDAYFIRHPLRPRLDDIKRRFDSLDRLCSELETQARQIGTAKSTTGTKETGTNDVGDESATDWGAWLSEHEQRESADTDNDLETIKKQINKLKRSYFFLRATIRGDILHGADVICGSSIAAGSPELDMVDFPVVFFDEGSMATEPVSLVPLMKGCRHLSIIGDHKQLPPVVTSAEAKESGLSRSLFERLIESKDRPVGSTMLDVQFRMHPSIADFPNRTFYDGALANGHTTHDIQPLQSSFLNGAGSTGDEADASRYLAFVSHQGSEAKAPNGNSLLNRSEADLVFEAVVDLLRRNPELRGSEIGIVTPYLGQQLLLEQKLRTDSSAQRQRAIALLGCDAARAGELAEVDIHTVDGFEGREKRAIVFSTVRTNSAGYVGFLADGRRLNVALTRAKSLLLVLGNIETFGNARLGEAGLVDSPDLAALHSYAAHVHNKGLLVDAHARLRRIRMERGEDVDDDVDVDTVEDGQHDEWQHVVDRQDYSEQH